MGKIHYWQKFEENGYYHIYNRGINGTSLFKKKDNFYFFLRKWEILISPYFDTLAYCLMPNHFHFLVKVKPLTSEIRKIIKSMPTAKSEKLMSGNITYNDFLEDQFKRLFSSYTLALNKQQSRTGSLFQKRFKRIGINDTRRLLRLLVYIHHNPIRHKFTSDYKTWKFSSYTIFVNNQITFICKEQVLLFFNDNYEKAKTAFVDFHKAFKVQEELF